MLETLIDTYGTPIVLTLAGLIIGVIFGAAAQHSRFCLRAAVVEVADKQAGSRFAVWLIAFSTALLLTQAAIAYGLLDATQSRQLSATGSLSGAIVGGLMFGAGMILARGCASRLLVLSATGNLRALVTGLVLTLVAQASLSGLLETPRSFISQLWTIEGGDPRSLLTFLNMNVLTLVTLTGFLFFSAIIMIRRSDRWVSSLTVAAMVGSMVAMGWIVTFQIAQNSFDIVPVSSITFTGPSTDTLMVLVTRPEIPFNFGIGLVLGVFSGSALSALVRGEWKLERFGPDTPMERYILGAVLMGFGAMLAGGCAVGAGVSGSAIFSLTAWVAVFCMWVGASATHLGMKAWSIRVAVPPLA